tara:strand:- start:262 stop:474 length:213 start_codon:yes stop_codon:yes gene_type:complete
MKLFFFLALLILCISTKAYAYLDPGAGSSILQLILAFLAGLGTFLSLYWSKFKYFVRKIFKKSNLDDNKK